MSYRYPPPAPEGHGDMPQPAYHHGYGIPIPPLPSMARHHVPIVPTKADESNPSLRRSYSMPDTGPGQYPEQGQAHATLGEKKRNKLGYHRTSIACSHCRRRKIRCIPSSDAQSTCHNCIRLKKECSFYPVDQEPGADGTSKESSRDSAAPGLVSSGSSSPTASTGKRVEVTPQPSLQSMPLPSTMGALPSRVRSSGPDGFSDTDATWSGPTTSQSFAYDGQPTGQWPQPQVLPNEASRPAGLNATWRTYPAESPLSGQFSPYAHAPPPSATWTTGSSEIGSGEDATWPGFTASGRSMSYSGESVDGHQQPQYITTAQDRPYDRRGSNFSNIYSAPIGAPMPGMPALTPAAMDPAGALPSHGQGAWDGQPGLHSHASFPRQVPGFTPVTYTGTVGHDHQGLADRNTQGSKRPY